MKDVLDDEYFPHAEAEQQLSTVVAWGRYTELCEYDASEERFYLPILVTRSLVH
jgi:NitT/TauT family transport system ATP-binding protein